MLLPYRPSRQTVLNHSSRYTYTLQPTTSLTTDKTEDLVFRPKFSQQPALLIRAAPEAIMKYLTSLLNKLTRSASGEAHWEHPYPEGPDFIIIGAQKSGTTSLYHYLCQHPQIIPAQKKQIHFFDGGLRPGTDNFQKGTQWYYQHFPDLRERPAGSITGEATPLYIYDPRVAQRIASLLPKVKLVAILRNPVERAISHFFHEQKIDKESLGFRDALQCEDERLAADLSSENFSGEAFRHYSYKRRGEYAEQLQRFYNLFPQENILVISSETLFADPTKLLSEVFSFLHVDSSFKVSDLAPRNVSLNRKPVDDTATEQLTDYFKKKNEELYQLLGKCFHW